jgi:hypothetical protein
MTTEMLPLNSESVLGPARQQEPTGELITLSKHTPVQAPDQPGNRISQAEFSPENTRNHFDVKGHFQNILRKLQKMELPGKEHLESYLKGQYRRNLRANSIENSLRAITSFLAIVKLNGKDYIEQISRADTEGYIEHEQDRGLNA